MAKRTSRRRRAIIRRRIFITVCSLLLVAVVAGTVALGTFVFKLMKGQDGATEMPSSTISGTTEAEPPAKKTTATVINTGDIMVHSTQLNGAKTDTGYDFSEYFKYISPLVSSADLAVANLEVTFGSTESGKYSGYPAFNTPDELAASIKNAGFDLMLTANNHIYDTGLFGFKRTLDVLKSNGLEYTGTRKDTSEPYYVIKNVNGIKIGMICYTYETDGDSADKKYLNGRLIAAEANPLVNSFSYKRIDSFYTAAQSAVTAMKNDGADFVVFYMHWGEEYQLKQNTWQSTIAQRLCNMGVNMIIGGHPHVIQPVSLLHSEDSQNTTVCLYSLGNAVSNQRQEVMDSCPSGHTEDGMLFSYTLEKSADGTVELSSIDVIPTWVNRYKEGSTFKYTIIPLEVQTDGSTKYALDETAAEKSQKSYDRTRAIVGAGLTECQQAIGCPVSFN